MIIEYDNLDRVTYHKDTDGFEVWYEYHDNSLKEVRKYNPFDRVVEYTQFDEIGNVTEIKDHTGFVRKL